MPRSRSRPPRACWPHAARPRPPEARGAAMARGALVIACGALAREIAALRRLNGWELLDVHCLPAELHNRPERIAPAVAAELRARRADYAHIFVAYADCGTQGALDQLLQ